MLIENTKKRLDSESIHAQSLDNLAQPTASMIYGLYQLHEVIIATRNLIIKFKLQKWKADLIGTPKLKRSASADPNLSHSYRFLCLAKALPFISNQFREVR